MGLILQEMVHVYLQFDSFTMKRKIWLHWNPCL